MLVECIDLYAHFNLTRKGGEKGFLTVYALDNNPELDAHRVRPAMLIIPGGSYSMVSFREGEPVAIAYLQKGFNAFVLEYSVAPDCIYPTQLREAAMAMIFIRERAKKYHVDPDRVAAVGFSAGGHLCGSLGVMFGREELFDLRNCDFIRPTAVILSYPVTVFDGSTPTHKESFNNLTNFDNELAKSLSLESNVTYLSSPAFIWHTAEDDVVPIYGSLKLAKSYIKAGVPCEFHVFEKGGHGLSLANNETNSFNESVANWLELSCLWLKNRGFKLFYK